MDFYIARQPIFDSRMGVYGYELLHRSSMKNFYDGTDDTTSTIELMNNALFVFGLDSLTGGSKAFINFSEDLLLTDTPLILPSESAVIEVLEHVPPTEEVVGACYKFKDKGYTIAIDDFSSYDNKDLYSPLIDVADIIKVEYNMMPLLDQRKLILEYGDSKIFLAEKVETRTDYEQAKQLGHTLFQGYFFSKPVTTNAKGIAALDMNLLYILSELNNPDPNFAVIAGYVERDLGLSYRFLKIANSVYYGAKTKIKSILHAIVHIGLSEFKRYVHLMLVNKVSTPENSELVKNSVIRAKVLSLIAIELGLPEIESDCFLAGLFSSIDAILNIEMTEILQDINFSESVTDALLGKDGQIRRLLDFVLLYESGDGEKFVSTPLAQKIGVEKFIKLYYEAVEWQISSLN